MREEAPWYQGLYLNYLWIPIILHNSAEYIVQDAQWVLNEIIEERSNALQECSVVIILQGIMKNNDMAWS